MSEPARTSIHIRYTKLPEIFIGNDFNEEFYVSLDCARLKLTFNSLADLHQFTVDLIDAAVAAKKAAAA